MVIIVTRFVGAVLIFTACTSMGISASAMYKRRAAQLEAFVLLITHIGAQIDGFLLPLDRIYANFKNRTLEGCGFLDALQKNGGVAALSECRRRMNLGDDEIGELEKFFVGLGRHAADEEARHCAYFEKRIGELAASARGQLAQKTRLCRAFGMLVGVMLAVVLL